MRAWRRFGLACARQYGTARHPTQLRRRQRRKEEEKKTKDQEKEENKEADKQEKDQEEEDNKDADKQEKARPPSILCPRCKTPASQTPRIRGPSLGVFERCGSEPSRRRPLVTTRGIIPRDVAVALRAVLEDWHRPERESLLHATIESPRNSRAEDRTPRESTVGALMPREPAGATVVGCCSTVRTISPEDTEMQDQTRLDLSTCLAGDERPPWHDLRPDDVGDGGASQNGGGAGRRLPGRQVIRADWRARAVS
ncbi:hypothetical protein B2J93_4658 [Marssonina coronariae]|uniref:Uncharacterized protein n=1 Tax=Diplocarpon coronariae TaxID=2795749 RepID=A0A218YVA4_9HELO|nr:hypothetical protein B2J93_4658 [Marssonina coronariae]